MESGYTEGLKPFVRKDLQVRILPPLPPAQFAAYSYLEVSLHERQTRVIERVTRAITELRPGRPVGLRRRGPVAVVNAYSNAWRHIVEQHPVQFLQGCIESDGCRHRRVVAGRNYPAYAFTNHPPDILQLFVWACGLVGSGCGRAERIG